MPGQATRPGARPIYVAPYYNPYAGDYYAQPSSPMALVTAPQSEPPPPAPPRPVMSEYFAESKPYDNLPQPGQTVYLLALKDGSLRQAVAFWREGDKLRYVQPDHRQESVAASGVDREATQRFNRERGLDIRLPE